MIAIVYYNDTANYLAVISIFISLSSVINKSFIFSVNAGKDLLTILFYWVCCIVDFIGIFFMISWVFYNPNNGDDNELSIYIYSIYIAKVTTFLCFGFFTLLNM